MRTPTRIARGFTLVELVITITVASIIVVFMALFIVMPMNAYSTQTQQAALVDAADSALRFMARDLRSALPNSVRVSTSGTVTALELLATADGARYQDGGPFSNPALVLDFTTADTAFATTVPFTQLTLPWSSSSFYLSIYNVGVPGANAYQMTNHHHHGGLYAQPESGHVEPGFPIRLRLSRQARVPGQWTGLLFVRYRGRHADALLGIRDCERATRRRRGLERGRRGGSTGGRQRGQLPIHVDVRHGAAQCARHADAANYPERPIRAAAE
jgi:prepilin-type N-terminal cleavage/methylation domain-containing protein